MVICGGIIQYDNMGGLYNMVIWGVIQYGNMVQQYYKQRYALELYIICPII